MPFKSETEKVRDRFASYLKGKIMDVGAGHDIITPDAFGVDARIFPHIKHLTTDLCHLSEQLPQLLKTFDVLYSSHTLEHLEDDFGAIKDWTNFLKKDGTLILYLPDDRHYDNEANPDHIRSYTYPQFLRFFKRAFPEYEVIDSGEDFGHDRYSFFIVARLKKFSLGAVVISKSKKARSKIRSFLDRI